MIGIAFVLILFVIVMYNIIKGPDFGDIARGMYLIDPDSFNEVDTSGFERVDPVRGKPVTGVVKKCHLFDFGKVGDPICFQWNALDDESKVGDSFLIPSDLVYKVGDVFLNDWVWIEPNLLGEKGQGTVVGCPRYRFIKPGDHVVFDSKMSHRVHADEFVNENIRAVKLEYILMYR